MSGSGEKKGVVWELGKVAPSTVVRKVPCLSVTTDCSACFEPSKTCGPHLRYHES
jgi:hypothetical protein